MTSPVGFINGVVTAYNADFSGLTPTINNGLISDNQVWMGSSVLNAGGTHVNVKTLTAGQGITFNSTATQLFIASSNGTGVTSVSGTANQVTSSPTTGLVVLSTPSTFIAPGSIASTTTLSAGTNLILPATTSLVGKVTLGGNLFMHSIGNTSNTFLGTNAGNLTTTSVNCTFIGFESGKVLTAGGQNTFVGTSSAASLTSGSDNTGFGWQSLNACVSGSGNTAIGRGALVACTNDQNTMLGLNAGAAIVGGATNVGCGYQALAALVSGGGNIGLGFQAGVAYQSTEANNICIGNVGTAAESGVIKIGTSATHTTCFIQGISGATVTGTAVLCSAAGQLGTIASSIRYKENVKDMDDSVSIMNLRPVEFNFIADLNKSKQYGLIAEEVKETFPYLCFDGKDGKPESVKYHEIAVLLLKEVQRLSERVRLLEDA